jgi:hypothetical protein
MSAGAGAYDFGEQRQGCVVNFNGIFGFVRCPSEPTTDYYFRREDIVRGTIPHVKNRETGPQVTFKTGRDNRNPAKREKAYLVHVLGASSDDVAVRQDDLSPVSLREMLSDNPRLASTMIKMVNKINSLEVVVKRACNKIAATDSVCGVKEFSVVLKGFPAGMHQSSRITQAEVILQALAAKLSREAPQPIYMTGAALGITFTDNDVAKEFIQLVAEMKGRGETQLEAEPLDSVKWYKSQLNYLIASADRGAPVTMPAGPTESSDSWTQMRRGFTANRVEARPQSSSVSGPMYFRNELMHNQQQPPAPPTTHASSNHQASIPRSTPPPPRGPAPILLTSQSLVPPPPPSTPPRPRVSEVPSSSVPITTPVAAVNASNTNAPQQNQPRNKGRIIRRSSKTEASSSSSSSQQITTREDVMSPALDRRLEEIHQANQRLASEVDVISRTVLELSRGLGRKYSKRVDEDSEINEMANLKKKGTRVREGLENEEVNDAEMGDIFEEIEEPNEQQASSSSNSSGDPPTTSERAAAN